MPPIQYAYFDPSKENYKAIQIRGLQFDLEPNATVEEDDMIVDMSIEKYVLPEEPEEGAWYEEPWVLLVGGGLPLLALAALMFVRKGKQEDGEDTLAFKEVPTEKPEFNTEKALRELLQHQGSEDFQSYFASMNKDLHAAMAYQLGMPEIAVVSASQMDGLLSKLNEDQAKEIKGLLEVCQTVRYGQQKPAEDLSVFTKKARSAFNAIQHA